MIAPWYTAVEAFDPTFGEVWTGYIAWSGLTQLEEVVSLDGSLCPSVIRKLIEEDWKHNVQEDELIEFFYDLDYLLGRVAGIARVNILAAVLDPSKECRHAFADPRFDFKGYDLIGRGMSALTNCGGFPLAFRNEELSNAGLISTLTRANDIRASLLTNYPDEAHADCEIWALWKMQTDIRK